MDILYLGHASFHIKGKSASIVTDPFDPEYVGIRFPKLSATIVTLSHDHADHNKAELVEGARKVISGPGEYEIEGVSVIGLPSFHDAKNGAERGKNTLYIYELEGLRLAHLGDLGHKLSEDIIEDIGDLDVLMIPVGGEYTIGPKEAVELTRAIEPKIVIPMHYKLAGHNPQVFSSLADEKPFVSELGLPERKEKKLSLKTGELSSENQEIVLLDII